MLGGSAVLTLGFIVGASASEVHSVAVETNGSTVELCVNPDTTTRYSVGTFTYGSEDTGSGDPLTAIRVFSPKVDANSLTEAEPLLFDERTPDGLVKRRYMLDQLPKGGWVVAQIWEGSC
ncbi:MAG TPA: hypothetical protein VIW94_07140 [Acidimicrobiia bacterium]